MGKLPVSGRPTICITIGQGPTALAVRAGGGCLDIFTIIYPFSPLSPSLWETARYRLKYCLKGPLSPKQASKQVDSRIQQSRASLFSVLEIDRDNGFVGWFVVLGLSLNFPKFFFAKNMGCYCSCFLVGWLIRV